MSRMGTHQDEQLRLARERTDLALQRTWLAEERTYSAWVRTGLAAAVAGLAIAELMRGGAERWIAATLGALFIATGGAMIVLGFLGFRRSARRMPPSISGCPPTWALGLLSLVLLAGTVLGLILAVRG